MLISVHILIEFYETFFCILLLIILFVVAILGFQFKKRRKQVKENHLV
jgi:hypothetical protein